MSDFMPCRIGEDQQAHLYPAGEPDHALCGRSVTDTSPSHGDRPACPECGKKLLTRIFRQAGPGGFSSVQVIVS